MGTCGYPCIHGNSFLIHKFDDIGNDLRRHFAGGRYHMIQPIHSIIYKKKLLHTTVCGSNMILHAMNSLLNCLHRNPQFPVL